MLTDLIAQTPYDWVDTLVKLVTAGGFGALVWYLVVKHIPAIEDRHRTERTEWREYIAKRDDSLNSLIKDFHESIEQVRKELSELRNDIHRELRQK